MKNPMNIKYCLPIIKKSKKEVLEAITKNKDEYEFFEVWFDTIKDIDIAFVNKLIKMLKSRLILLSHRGNKVKTKASKEQKRQILKALHRSQSFIDLDISEKAEVSYVRENKLKIKTIASYHDYKGMPKDFGKVLREMNVMNPTIYKFALTCNSEVDAINLLVLQQLFKEQRVKHIVLGMGKCGALMRIFGTLWGNELIYAPKTKAEASAPGQLTKRELETIFKVLSK